MTTVGKLVFDKERLQVLAGVRSKPHDPDEFDGKPVQGAAHLWQVKTAGGGTFMVTTASASMQELAEALQQVALDSDLSSVERLGDCFGLFDLRDERVIERLVKLNKHERGQRSDELVDSFSLVRAIRRGAELDEHALDRLTSQAPEALLTSSIVSALVTLGVSNDDIRKIGGLSKEPDEAGYASIAEPVIDRDRHAWAKKALGVLWSRSRTECDGDVGQIDGFADALEHRLDARHTASNKTDAAQERPDPFRIL